MQIEKYREECHELSNLESTGCNTIDNFMHMLDHLENNNIVFPLQHGFRNGHSCESQLIVTRHDRMQKLVSKQQTDLIILDFSKTFDTVPHKKLILKLNK